MHLTSRSDPNEQAYFWLPESELTSTAEMLDTPLTSRMYIDRNEVVRVRVESDEFFDDEPGPPKAADGVIVQRELRRSPFQITVCHFTVTLHILLHIFTICLSYSAPSLNRVWAQFRGGTVQQNREKCRK
jgi:RNA polymerase III subunit Rpc25